MAVSKPTLAISNFGKHLYCYVFGDLYLRTLSNILDCYPFDE
jgi:hypothetical protein